ncbi:MAG: division/cell wall cluster transcriptional repressor MraZ, partial [Oscillospiraceae bacterium]|nr:division/cell wall cluster transcriptional repressor MraZ [Oscillospiraceae bacterium]
VIAKAMFVPCAQVYSTEDWETFEKNLYEKNHPRDVDQLLRKMEKREVPIDEQGRFFLDSCFREHAGIDSEVSFKTVGKKVELWNEEEWLKNMKETDIETVGNKIIF